LHRIGWNAVKRNSLERQRKGWKGADRNGSKRTAEQRTATHWLERIAKDGRGTQGIEAICKAAHAMAGVDSMSNLGKRSGKGPKTTRTTISVPTVLYKRMAKVKANVNWSSVASQAFLKVVEAQEKQA
jgi:hypothetical protein